MEMPVRKKYRSTSGPPPQLYVLCTLNDKLDDETSPDKKNVAAKQRVCQKKRKENKNTHMQTL